MTRRRSTELGRRVGLSEDTVAGAFGIATRELLEAINRELEQAREAGLSSDCIRVLEDLQVLLAEVLR